MIAGFIAYNLFFAATDDRANTLINIIYASVLFGYMAFMAFVVLKKMRK